MEKQSGKLFQLFLLGKIDYVINLQVAPTLSLLSVNFHFTPAQNGCISRQIWTFIAKVR